MWKTWHHKKDTCLQYESWNKKPRIALFNLIWERVQLFVTLCMSMNDYKGSASINFEDTNKFQQVGKFATAESAKSKDQLYTIINTESRKLL